MKTSAGQPRELVFVFTCKVDPDHHQPHRRPRLKTSSGTRNLNAGAKACNRRLGASMAAASSSRSIIPYSSANHRTILALRCSKSMRPFTFVQDPLYQAEVDMLRPGTQLPDPTTVSRDVKLLYKHLAPHVSSYFKV
ncbi:hypothetical protein FA13DRAFT_1918268 [Coprinellus micaceus]|uniref:Uncharacterized protein n=1 Tax=Coprinellus micaceus TaxID=71717 RepID=A0A4Y7TJU6_COPMI|nr:hypothetical protein FA13DRAFT_1918268 [Coprinellus micaceus]